MNYLFNQIRNGNNISHSKPDPEVFLKAAEMLEIPSEECLIVDDADAGVLAGKNAGMKTLAVRAAVGGDWHSESLEHFDICESCLKKD